MGDGVGDTVGVGVGSTLIHGAEMWTDEMRKRIEKSLGEDKLVIRGDNIYRKLFIHEHKGQVLESIWSDASNAANAADEIKNLFGSIVFDTPKPEPFIQRIIELSSSESDIVLDYHLG